MKYSSSYPSLSQCNVPIPCECPTSHAMYDVSCSVFLNLKSTSKVAVHLTSLLILGHVTCVGQPKPQKYLQSGGAHILLVDEASAAFLILLRRRRRVGSVGVDF